MLFTLDGDICLMFPEIQLWCNTYQPLGSKHGSQPVLFHIPASRHWWVSKLGSIVPPLPDSVSVFEIPQVAFAFEFESQPPNGKKQSPNYHLSDLNKVIKQQNGIRPFN